MSAPEGQKRGAVSGDPTGEAGACVEERPSEEARKEAFELMLFAYKEADRSQERITSRAGLALAIVLGALATLGPSAGAAMASVSDESARLVAVVVGAAFALLLIGVALLAYVLLVRGVEAGYSRADLLHRDWRMPPSEFYLQQLANLEQGASNLRKDADTRSIRLNAALVCSLFGVLALIVVAFQQSAAGSW